MTSPDILNKLRAHPLVSKIKGNRKIQVGLAAVVVLLGFMMLGGGGPSNAEVEKVYRVHARSALNAQFGGINDLGSMLGVNTGKAEQQAALDKIKIDTDIIDKHELDNGDWEVKLNVNVEMDEGQEEKATVRLLMTEANGEWRILREEEL